jgi:hypothetical protein
LRVLRKRSRNGASGNDSDVVGIRNW